MVQSPWPQIPVWKSGELQVVRWGNGRSQSRRLPRTGWAWLDEVESGAWAQHRPLVVDIPATLGCERGIWYRVRQGMRGILVPDERGMAVCYMLLRSATRYYTVMTRSESMPVMIGETI